MNDRNDNAKSDANRIKDAIDGFIPRHMKSRTVVNGFKLLSAVSVVPATKSMDNYERNKQTWRKIKAKLDEQGISYIESQDSLKDMFYGTGKLTAKDNACEIIAIYNAMIALGQKGRVTSFPALLHFFEGNGIALFGKFGTSPHSMKRFLEKRGFKVDVLLGEEGNRKNIENISNKCNTFIMVVFNNKDRISSMIHTMCITVEEDGYVIHNDYEGSKSYESLSDAVFGYRGGESKLIALMGIRK